MTAAYLAHDNDDAVSWLPSNLKEYKGVSFVTGGDQNATTLANYLAFYYNHYHQLASPAGDDANVPLLGSSSGVKIVSKCISLNPIDLCPPQDWIFRRSDVDGLNAAISGAKFEQLSYELEYLLEEYNKLAKAYPERTSDTWKLISIIIGTNNACEEPCDQAFAGPRDQPSFFRDRLNEVLNKLENSQMAPKLIVVLGALLDISDMEKWIAETDTNSFCAGTEEARRDSCPCVFSDVGRQRLSLRISTYNEVMKNVTQSYHEQPDPKITVLYWPGLATLNVSSIPIDFVSPYDCYHPSQHGQAGLATLLWYPFEMLACDC